MIAVFIESQVLVAVAFFRCLPFVGNFGSLAAGSQVSLERLTYW